MNENLSDHRSCILDTYSVEAADADEEALFCFFAFEESRPGGLLVPPLDGVDGSASVSPWLEGAVT